jgi:hypothetical protein
MNEYSLLLCANRIKCVPIYNWCEFIFIYYPLIPTLLAIIHNLSNLEMLFDIYIYPSSINEEA